MNNNSFIWRPLTQHGLAPVIPNITHAEGAYLYDDKGNQYLDAVSSWWTVTHGHNHPKIQNAILRQVAQLDHVMASQFTHPAAEEFVDVLHGFLAPELRYCFFSDSGSTANEAALRMALGYWYHQGRSDRNLILSFDRGYHGATLANTSVGGRGAFSTPYEKLLFEVQHFLTPSAGNEDQSLGQLKKILQEKSSHIAALMIEPLVLGAAGMVMVQPEIIKEIVALCRQHDVLIIFDEVMTGFGRTGTMFAYEQIGTVPDILTLGKGITGGALPMGLTVANEQIYRAFYAEDRSKMLFYSTSYGGNPIACAAALANLQIWREEPVLQQIKEIEEAHRDFLPALKKSPYVQNARIKGTIVALDLPVTGNYLPHFGGGQNREAILGGGMAPKPSPEFAEANSTPPARGGVLSQLQEFYLKNRIVLRPIGQTVYILPPYCITRNDLKLIYDTIEDSLSVLPG